MLPASSVGPGVVTGVVAAAVTPENKPADNNVFSRANKPTHDFPKTKITRRDLIILETVSDVYALLRVSSFLATLQAAN